MFPSFLPAAVAQLTEDTSIALAQQIQQTSITTPLQPDPILTTYVQQGDEGTPILLLNGFDSSLLEFRRLIPKLAPHIETWALDLLGFGFTERPQGVDFSPTDMKTHLHSFWQQMIQRPMILAGASMGGATALDFALTYPEAVEKLVLLDSSGYAPSPKATKFIMPPCDRWLTNFLRNPKVRRWVSLQAYCDKNFVTPDAECCAALHLEDPNWHRALVGFTKSGGYNFLYETIQNIPHPTLILWGDADKIMGIKDADKFDQTIANSQLIWIPDCGHVPHLEQSQLTADNILAFLASPAKRPSQTISPISQGKR
ncbi:alpha/beta hydrolase [Acaryochloris sp. IP29b_bin.137]|uniref:alpha/beta fold hydrolase n=1 Tax=Acaryochloris sp. IP29b_bin.137 TaxID=2969217 RepID=UPI002624BD27|nr:alpha/beta hydrolase [Acaryochloris sp. IP29b_bin.137]